MSAAISLSMRLLKPPRMDTLLSELERSGWHLVGDNGQIVYSVSDDDLTEELVADQSARASVVQEIAKRHSQRKQSMLTIGHAERGSIALAFLASGEAFIVEAHYSCYLREHNGRIDLNDAVELIIPAVEKASDWIASYSVSLDR